jgi:hypothetical protein
MKYFLMDLERTLGNGVPADWKSNKRGYTYNIHEAGLYSEKEAEEIVKADFNERTIKISLKAIEDFLLIRIR